jgi:hypothetical protein
LTSGSRQPIPAAAANATDTLDPLALAIARMAPVLPARTRETVAALLARSLGAPSAAEIRAARLGLLMALVDGNAEVPSTDAYERLRVQRKAQDGASWPAASTLIRAYGGWTRAVRAAFQLRAGAKTLSEAAVVLDRGGFSNDEVLAAIAACARCIGCWEDSPEASDCNPTPTEYTEWRRLSRRLALHAGTPVPRPPSLTAIRAKFGSWDRAVAAAGAA